MNQASPFITTLWKINPTWQPNSNEPFKLETLAGAQIQALLVLLFFNKHYNVFNNRISSLLADSFKTYFSITLGNNFDICLAKERFMPSLGESTVSQRSTLYIRTNTNILRNRERRASEETKKHKTAKLCLCSVPLPHHHGSSKLVPV